MYFIVAVCHKGRFRLSLMYLLSENGSVWNSCFLIFFIDLASFSCYYEERVEIEK